MSVKSAVRDGFAALHEREQQVKLALLNRTVPATHTATVTPENQGMTHQSADDDNDLAMRVLRAIEASECDFRTPHGLADELGVSEASVVTALVQLGDRVRRPIGAGTEYQDWFRSSARPRTWRERWWLFRALAGHTGPGI